MKKLLSVLVVLVLVAWGGYKGATWWFANETLAEIRRGLAGQGMLERGRIGSEVRGTLILSDTRFQPFRLTRPLEIGELRYRTDSPQALLTSLYGEHPLPSSWRLDAFDWSLALSAAMLKEWVTDTDMALAGNGGSRTLFALVCAPDARQHLGSGDLLRMGIDRLEGDAQLAQTSEGLKLEVFTRETGSLEIFWRQARLRLEQGVAELTPAPESVRVVLRDGGLMRRVAAYCARETGLPPAAWADAVMTRFQQGLNARGYRASPQLVALYRQWLSDGGELTLELDPAADLLGLPVRQTQAVAESGAQAPASAEAEILYNGARVPGVYLMAVADDSPSGPAVVRSQPAERPVQPDTGPYWQPLPVDEAGQWLGYTVRVTLGNGNTVEGRLTSAGDGRVEVARPIDGGEVAYPMASRAIERFEVRRRGRGDGG